MTNPKVERLFDNNIVKDLMTTAIIHFLIENNVQVDEDGVAEFVVANFEEIIKLTIDNQNEEE